MKSPIKWIGGKTKYAPKLVQLFPIHKGFVECFGGSLAVLFEKPKSRWEVVNDIDSDLVNFWRVVKNNHEEFIKSFEYEIVSREVFNDYRDKYLHKNYKDDLERAHIFYYIVKAGFGSRMVSPTFGTGRDRNRLRIEDVEKDIKTAHRRIRSVTIENDSYERVMRRYDGKDTFFFLDPPYRGTYDYGNGFTDDDYIRFGDICKDLKGKFMITINDDEFIRDIFKDFTVIDSSVFYSVGKEKRKEYNELIIINYKI